MTRTTWTLLYYVRVLKWERKKNLRKKHFFRDELNTIFFTENTSTISCSRYMNHTIFGKYLYARLFNPEGFTPSVPSHFSSATRRYVRYFRSLYLASHTKLNLSRGLPNVCSSNEIISMFAYYLTSKCICLDVCLKFEVQTNLSRGFANIRRSNELVSKLN